MGGGGIGMAQHGLDRMDIGAAPNQMGRKGMAQGMRRYIGLDTGLFPVVLDNLPEALAAHGLTVTVGKQPIRIFALQKLRPGLPHVLDQGRCNW